jgi:hypothetical protein
VPDPNYVASALARRIATAAIAQPAVVATPPGSPASAGSVSTGTGLTVSDGTRNRVSVGKLAAYTDPSGVLSPAGYGIRTLDAAGNLLHDHAGLIAVVNIIGSVTNQSQSSTGGNGSYQAMASSQVTFSLSRQGTVLVLGAAFVYDPNVSDTGFDLGATVLIDGAHNANQSPIFDNLTGALSCTPFAIATLSAGTHTAALGVNQTTGHNWASSGVYLFVLQLGG